MSSKNFNNAILAAGGLGTKEYAAKLKELETVAIKARNHAGWKEIAEARKIGMGETFERLMRNVNALEILLSQAIDAAGYINTEVADIFKAQDDALNEKIKRKRDIEKKMQISERNKSNYEKRKEEKK